MRRARPRPERINYVVNHDTLRSVTLTVRYEDMDNTDMPSVAEQQRIKYVIQAEKQAAAQQEAEEYDDAPDYAWRGYWAGKEPWDRWVRQAPRIGPRESGEAADRQYHGDTNSGEW